jgi:hypothetical protein
VRSRRSLSLHRRFPRLIRSFTARVAALLVLLLTAAPYARAAALAIAAERLEGPGFVAREARAGLDPRGHGRLELSAASVEAQGRTWRKPGIVCEPILNRGTRIGCESGVLDLGEKIPLRFSYDIRDDAVDAELLPAVGERWHVSGQPAGGGWNGRARVEQGSLVRVTPWLPPAGLALKAGQVSGTFAIALSPHGVVDIEGDLAFGGVGFSDASGLHAAENLAGVVELAVAESDGIARFRASVDWHTGELFWQPVYLKGGHALFAEGTLGASRIAIDRGRMRLKRVGEVAFSASWDRGTGALVTSAGGGAALDIPGAYEELAQPLLADTVAADLRTAGTADFGWRFGDGALQAFYLNLHRASFEDRKRRFALVDLDAAIPWNRGGASQARVTLAGAEVLRLPIGRIEVPIELDGLHVRVAQVEVPLLDGSLRMNDFVARREGDTWEWTFAGGITPLAVEALTRTLGVHVMYGTLSAVVPKVHYRSSTVTIEGALLFQVFDGTVVVNRLSLLDPLGRAPRLYADLDMRNLDLDLVTRTFAFGSITGRIDATVQGLELASWRPVALDAWVGSSPGSYPKRISQRAVESIAALGGGSATAAVQRTALRFFEEFGYRRIGWRCRLANGVCEMSGIAPKDSGYVIVEGGGIPAITVMGYNRAVDWGELIARLARVTAEGSAPLVQ